MKIFYSAKCLGYAQPGHPESPARLRASYEYLEEQGCEFTEPAPCSDEDILLAHTQAMLESVKNGTFFDFDTPVLPGIYEIAKLSAGGAVAAAMHCLQTGERAFSLMRPPGHHASKNRPSGFCYFNNVAIASLRAVENVGKIAIVDFDVHHGNGTEDIVLGRKEFLYISLHQSPHYPGTGQKSRGNCLNYPVPAGAKPGQYISLMDKVLANVTAFNPDVVAISAGFDSYKLDPLAGLVLEQETYREIGRMLAGLGKPAFSVLEGGYSRDLPECIHEFMMGLEE